MKSNDVTDEELDALISLWWKAVGTNFYGDGIKDFKLLDEEEIARHLNRFKSIQVIFVKNKIINFILK